MGAQEIPVSVSVQALPGPQGFPYGLLQNSVLVVVVDVVGVFVNITGASVGVLDGVDVTGASVGALVGFDVTGASVGALVGFDVTGATVATGDGIGAAVVACDSVVVDVVVVSVKHRH